MEEFSLLPFEESKKTLAKSRVCLARFGLSLTEGEETALMAGHTEALRDTGRVELGDGILPQLIEAFCNSPYLGGENLAEELLTLQELFYHWKNEAGELTPDEELLSFMRQIYDEKAHGAAEYLAGFSLRELKGEMEHE